MLSGTAVRHELGGGPDFWLIAQSCGLCACCRIRLLTRSLLCLKTDLFLLTAKTSIDVVMCDCVVEKLTCVHVQVMATEGSWKTMLYTGKIPHPLPPASTINVSVTYIWAVWPTLSATKTRLFGGGLIVVVFIIMPTDWVIENKSCWLMNDEMFSLAGSLFWLFL